MTRFTGTLTGRRARLASAIWIVLVALALLLYLAACGGSPAAQTAHAATAATVNYVLSVSAGYPGAALHAQPALARGDTYLSGALPAVRLLLVVTP